MKFLHDKICPLIDEFTNGWKDPETAPYFQKIKAFVYQDGAFKILLSYRYPSMSVEADLPQRQEDCDYSIDEAAFLKPGFYVASKIEGALIKITPLGWKCVAQEAAE